MGKHVSVILREDLFHLLEAKRGLASKSAFCNMLIEKGFRALENEG